MPKGSVALISGDYHNPQSLTLFSDTVFRWANSRRHAELEALLGDYRGLLQSDAYGAYPAFAAAHPGVERVGCWAHARRGFFDSLKDHPKAAAVVLRVIGKLYACEQRWDQAGVTTERAVLHQLHFARSLHWLKKIATGLRAPPPCRYATSAIERS